MRTFGFIEHLDASDIIFLTLYARPEDAPEFVVMRASLVRSGSGEPIPAAFAGYYNSADQARDDVPIWGKRFAPMEGDPANMIETWML